MEITVDNYILLLTFIKLTAFSSVAYIIFKINKSNCWTQDMKYYRLYFIVAIIGSTLNGISHSLSIQSPLNILLMFYMTASLLLVLAIEEKTRTKQFTYSAIFIIILLFLSSILFDFTDKTNLFIHLVASLLFYIPLLFLAIKKAQNFNNIGYYIFASAFLLVIIPAPLELNALLDNDTLLAYTIATMGTDAGFMLVIIGFLAKVLMNELNVVNKLALTDTLTGMNNRRGLDHMLQSIIPSSNRDNRCFSVVTIDIDFFKKINDTYGHDGGDIVLKEFANIIKTNHRNSDISARFGGEEFVIVLPDTDKETSIVIAEKLRKSIEKSIIKLDEKSINITASFGVDTSCNEINIDELLKNADKALYITKFAGRNMVVHIDDNCIDDISSFMKKKQNKLSN